MIQDLLFDTLEAYYWIGFILADGSIKDRRLRISLSYKDYNHLKKFCRRYELKHRLSKGVCSGSIQNDCILSIAEKFDIHPRKTYFPPNPNIIPDDDLALAMLIGFIDGDGHIRKQTGRNDCLIQIKNHRSWKPFLDKFASILSTEQPKSKINNQGYANLNISDRRFIRRMYSFATNNGLPIMKRKWVTCKDMPLSKKELDKKGKINELLEQGLTQKEICGRLSVSKAYVSMIKKGKR